jgi:hypothetical protein
VGVGKYVTGVIPDPTPTPAPLSVAQSLRLYYLWGVTGADMSNTDEGTVGEPIYDKSFRLADPKAQRHLYSVCQLLLNNSRFLFQ